ncbi:MAG: glycosyltransferase [Candidatus Omnitrophica bacterium]|nr:glycosyltransferase [Candidatus Omnitrophota bacterium]
MRPVTVMFLETSLRIGGTEMMVTQLVERMDPRRFRPVLCCFYDPGILGERLMRAGIPVHHNLAAHRWDLRLPVRLLRLLRQERVDVLYIINQPLTQFWGAWCGLLARVPVRLSAIRSTGKIHRIHRRMWINRLTFQAMTRITALSETHKAYLVEREGILEEQIEIIPNGVDLGRFTSDGDGREVRASLGLRDSEPVVGIVAMLRPEKAHEIFLRAAARVLREVPTTHFVVVGDGPERPRLEQLTDTLGIRDHVHFLGAREDAAALVMLLDVATLCSHAVVETLSNAVLEYMAAGRPVVATRVGSLPELIEEGRTGFLVAPGDWEGLAERVVRLLQDRGLAARMGRAGKEKVQEYYTLERMVQDHEALFDRLLNHR